MPGTKKGLTGCLSSQNSDSSPDSDQRFWNKSPEGWRRSTYVHPSYSTLDVPKYVHGTPPPTASTFGSDSRIGTPPAPASGFRSDPRITPYFDKNPATSSTYAASGYGTRSQISTGSTRPLYSGAPPLPSGPSFAARTGGQPGVSPVHTVRKTAHPYPHTSASSSATGSSRHGTAPTSAASSGPKPYSMSRVGGSHGSSYEQPRYPR